MRKPSAQLAAVGYFPFKGRVEGRALCGATAAAAAGDAMFSLRHPVACGVHGKQTLKTGAWLL